MSAYASAELLPFLEQRFEIELFCDTFERYRHYHTHHYLRAFERHARRPFDIFFYQIEDGPIAHFCRFHSSLMPGVVLFHDAVLWDSGPVPLYVSPWERIVQRFHDRTVPWPPRSEKFHYKGPLAYREAAFSGVALFSTEHGHHEFRRLATQRLWSGPSYYLPFPIDPNQSQVPHGALPVVAYCGSPRIEHRAHKLLPALLRTSRRFRFSWLIDRSEEAQAQELLKEFPLRDVELLFGRTPKHWAEVARRADVALHSFFSAFGQPGVYLATSLMIGVPSIVSTFGTTEYLPDNLVCKVRPGDHESYEIQQWLEKLLAGGEEAGALCRTLSDRARRFAREFHDREAVARDLCSVFERHRDMLHKQQSEWGKFESEARVASVDEARRLLTWGEADEALAGALFGEEEYCFRRIVGPAFEELGWK